MFLNISFWMLAAIIAVAWILQVLMTVKQHDALIGYEWEEYRNTFVNQANRLVYLLILLPVAWFLNNYVLFGYSLAPLTWAIRVYAGFVAITEILIFFVSIVSTINRQPWMIRMIFASLAIAITSALVALSV